MKRIRIGKDISMRWEITTDGVAIPLDGRDLTVEIKSPAGIENNIPYRIDGNILIMTYYGYEQKRTGEYSITLWEKKGKPGQNVVDVIRAFELVRTSQEENDFVGGDLQIESVDLGTENFDILTEGGYRAINIDTLQAEALEDSVNINGKTYSNESFTITLPKANLDSAGVMGASDVRTLKEHADSIAQIKTSCEENASDIERVSNVVDTHESRLGGIDAEISSLNTEVSTLQSKVDENTTSISQINTELDNKNGEIAQINAKLDEHTESINAKITTNRIEDGAITSEKIATSAFDSTLSVNGKIAPADVVGERLSELEGKADKNTNIIEDIANIEEIPSKNLFDGDTSLGYIRSNDYGFTSETSGRYIATLPIKVKPNYIYYIKRGVVCSNAYIRCLISADDATGKSSLNYINGNKLGILVDDKPFRVPADCHYIQAQLVFGEVPTTDDYKKLMLEEIGETYPSGFHPSPYEPYGTRYTTSVKEDAMPDSYADTKKDVNNLKEDVKEIIGERVIVSVPAQVTDRNVYLNASGVITSSSSGATICYFDVEEGQEYTLKVPTTGNVASIVWAYSNGDTKNATPPATPIIGNSSPYEGTIKINSNLGKIVVCYHKAEGIPTLEYEKREGGIEIKSTKSLKILCFGNSFAQDSMMYVPSILKKICPELELAIGICVIGSCSLARHLVNITNTASEAWTPTNYDYEYSKNGSAWASKSLSGEECLQEEDWDVITFQQNGENAGRPVSAWEDNIGKSIRPLQKALYTKLGRTVKLGFILTHGSYDSDTDNLKIRWQNTALNVKKVEEETAFVEIFPYGTAIQNLRTTSLVNLGYGSAKNLLADSAHLQDGIGCLCACYTNALKIMQLAGIDKSVFGDDTLINMDFITYNNILGTNPSSLTQDDIIGMSDDNRYLAQLSAIQAMRTPWAITDMSAFE